MNKSIKSMLEKGILFGGKISYINEFAIFQRLSLKELKNLEESEIAYATGSMGRAIFQVDKDGRIKNIKGVDSHLENSEIITKQLTGADETFELNPANIGNSYRESIYPINLVKFVDGSLSVRIRGASPLEDLEEEAEKNKQMQGTGIKLPKIEIVREMPVEISKKLGLPIKVKGSYDDFGKVSYRRKNDERKAFLHKSMGDDYIEDLPKGLRAETFKEYFIRTGLMESDKFKKFAEEKGETVEAFVKYVDKSYALGQRHGQTIRRVENPFRISDLEYYVKNQNIGAIEDIATFSNQLSGRDEPFESIFARQMGTNVALMMNNGWKYNNFMHRQDFSLAGEMCDDAYDNIKEHLEYLDKNSDKGKAIIEYERNQYYLQIYAISTTIKVLQDEMNLRGKFKEETDRLLENFVQSFSQNIDFQKVGEIFGDSKEQVEEFFTTLTASGNDYAYAMAEELQNPEQPKKYNEQVLQGHKDFAEFYVELSRKLAKELHIGRIEEENKTILESGIEATEESTKTGVINGQEQTIKNNVHEKNIEKDTQVK